MSDRNFDVGSYVSISEKDIRSLIHSLDSPSGPVFARVVANVDDAFSFSKDLKLVMFDEGSTWGHPYHQLGKRYRELITKANAVDFNPNFQHRRYCGIRTEMLKDGSRFNMRVATTVEKLRASSTGEGSHILVNPDLDIKTVLRGTIVDPGIFRTCSIVMFDESDKYGYLLEDMGKEVRGEIDKLNIPNVHKRRFICASHSDLSFTDSNSVTTRNNTMSNKIVETLKGDAKEAAYRVAGTQITNGVKLGVVKLFESKGGKSEHMVMLKEVLDSEVGDSLIALLLGYGLNYAPVFKDDPRIQKLSEEFRINGMPLLVTRSSAPPWKAFFRF
jgi:hypothetical protein